jgi:hypothetical protein
MVATNAAPVIPRTSNNLPSIRPRNNVTASAIRSTESSECLAPPFANCRGDRNENRRHDQLGYNGTNRGFKSADANSFLC